MEWNDDVVEMFTYPSATNSPVVRWHIGFLLYLTSVFVADLKIFVKMQV